ncbi:hypothetical protein [Sagittula sp. SSi028]|uniref:hypothetical protein n=1 Tax=Sagittula sp. SSi028 TaxID=3400636 RepID=UPI003AF76CFE
MYVTHIEFKGFKTCIATQATQGSVILIANERRVVIPLTLPHRRALDNRRQRLLVLAHALYMARKLPQLRRRGALRFAPGLLPQELTRA